MKFQLGEVLVTPRASQVLAANSQSLDELLARHQSGDWGDVSAAERRLNDEGVVKRFNLVSNYRTPGGERVMVITRADRESTFVHLAPDSRPPLPADTSLAKQTQL
ncbi:MAG: hypothetical protein AB7U73_14205 [Pirellulales bacterium]